MEQLINITNYEDYKCALKKELLSAAEGFVRIGYLLKKARDTNILEGSGYSNVNEFAQKEFGLEKSQVSRFININERFADEEHPDQLKEQYKGFGVAKLSIMLTIPDTITEEITPEYAKTEVQAIKEEYEAEQKISDVEVMLEPQAPEKVELGTVTMHLDSTLMKVLHQLFHDNKQLYKKICELPGDIFGKELQTCIYEAMAPEGEAMHSVRVQGIGRMMLSVKDLEQGATIINLRSTEKERYTWEDIEQAIDNILDCCAEASAEEYWEKLYGEPFEEIAPVQQPKEPEKPEKKERTQAKKPEQRKVSKVTKAPVKEPPAAVVEEEEEEEQIEGQMRVEDYPELLPEGEEDGRIEHGNTDDMPDAVRTDDDADATETERAEIPCVYEEVGTSESGGSTEDSGAGKNEWLNEEQEWWSFNNHEYEIKKIITVYGMKEREMPDVILKRLHDHVTAAKEALERIQMLRG